MESLLVCAAAQVPITPTWLSSVRACLPCQICSIAACNHSVVAKSQRLEQIESVEEIDALKHCWYGLPLHIAGKAVAFGFVDESTNTHRTLNKFWGSTVMQRNLIGMLLVVFASSLCFEVQAQAVAHGVGAPALITEAINEGRLIRLGGNTRSEANAVNDRGRVADALPMEHMFLQLRRSPSQEQGLVNLIDELHDPKSSKFHHWLSAAEFGSQYGLAEADLQTIVGWLQLHGFSVNVVYSNGLLIDFSGTAGQVRQTFHTEIHNLVVKGQHHIANMSDPQIPAALSEAVVGVVSLHDFRPRGMHEPRAQYTYTSGSTTYQAMVPADLATIYNLNPLFSNGTSGQGQTIVVVEDSNVYNPSDWTTFRSAFGLSSYTSGSFTQVQPPPASGNNNCINPGVEGAEDEAILDAEWSSAAAPSAAIELASCEDAATFGGLIALQNLINASSSPPAIVSVSYGECETVSGATTNAAFSSAYQQAVAEGVSVFVAAGDGGPAACDRNAAAATHGIGTSGWASTPYNVAVGGTDFGDTYAGTNSGYWNSGNTGTYGSAKSYVPEIPWNNSCASVLLASFNGFSTTYGSGSFCNSPASDPDPSQDTRLIVGGGGGPSGCATGTPATPLVVSGSCAGTAKPSWQTGVLGIPNDGVRDTPDVSLFAANGIWNHYYVYCDTDGGVCSGAPSAWSGAGGTSFSSPIMAGIQALVNQTAGARQGNPNYIYYKLAASEYGANGNNSCNSTLGNTASSACIFYDVTQGDLDVDCEDLTQGVAYDCYLPSGTLGVLSTSNSAYNIAYGATTGWDFATGIGTVNAYNLVKNWSNASVPSAPTNLMAVAGNGQVTLSWTASSGAASYDVYEGTSAGGEGATPIQTGITGTNAVLSGLTNGATYYFKVSAVNAGGQSALSIEASAKPLAPPGVPTGLIATPANAQVTVSWTASSGAVSYDVYKGTSAGGEGSVPVATTFNGFAVVTGLINGTNYFFKVNAVNVNGTQGALSAEASATPVAAQQVPAAPTGLSGIGTLCAGCLSKPINGTAGEVVLSWNATSGATTYNVYQGTSSGTETLFASVSNPSATLEPLNEGATYFYEVTGVNAKGEGAKSGEISVTTPTQPICKSCGHQN